MYDDSFEKCWSIYPRKVGKSLAYKKYMKAIKGTDHETIYNGVAAYAESVRGTEQRFICHFSTYLSQERYLDDYSQIRADNRKTSAIGNAMAIAAKTVQKAYAQGQMATGREWDGMGRVFDLPATGRND